MIMFGLLNCFLGLHFFTATLFTAGFSITFMIVIIFFSNFWISATSGSVASWMAVIIAALLGITVGGFAAKLYNIGFFVLGAFGGYLLGSLLYTMFLHYIDNGATWVLYTTCGILATVFGLLGLIIKNVVTIIVTSFIGSYLLIRTISIFAGGFPNEFILAEQIKMNNYNFPW